MPNYTTGDSGAQDGNLTVGGFWVDGGQFSVLAHGADPQNWIGMQFLVPLTFDSELGVPLDPQGFISIVLALTPRSAIGPLPDAAGTLTPYLVPESAPSPYFEDLIFPANSLRPGQRDEIVAGDSVAVADGDTSDQLIAIDIGVLAPYIRSSTWRGIISLSILWTPDSAGDPNRSWGSSTNAGTAQEAAVPDIETVEHPFFTGLMNFHQEERGFATQDDRLGTFILSSRRVPDRYQPGLLVHSDDIDPVDPPDKYRPNPREGANEDDRERRIGGGGVD